MFDRKALKAKAKEFAFNNKWNIWKGVLLVSFISGAVEAVGSVLMGTPAENEVNWIGLILSLVISLATMPLSVGLVDYLVNLVRGKEVDLTGSLFKYYKKEYLFNVIKQLFVAYIIVFACSLLFVIPGIIMALKYAMISFIIVDKSAKELETTNVRAESSKLMDGHKWEFVVLQLSFILWMLLVEVTFGIAAIWVMPYTITTNVMYYDELKKLSK